MEQGSKLREKVNKGAQIDQQSNKKVRHIVIMKALKCKTLGAAPLSCTIICTCKRGQMRECTGKYTDIWQRQKL